MTDPTPRTADTARDALIEKCADAVWNAGHYTFGADLDDLIALAAAEALSKEERGPEAFDWLLRWLRDVLLVAVGAGSDHVLNLDQKAGMQALAERIDIDELLDLINDLEKLERQAHRNLNVQMALETILLRVRHLLTPQDTADTPR